MKFVTNHSPMWLRSLYSPLGCSTSDLSFLDLPKGYKWFSNAPHMLIISHYYSCIDHSKVRYIDVDSWFCNYMSLQRTPNLSVPVLQVQKMQRSDLVLNSVLLLAKILWSYWYILYTSKTKPSTFWQLLIFSSASCSFNELTVLEFKAKWIWFFWVKHPPGWFMYKVGCLTYHTYK